VVWQGEQRLENLPRRVPQVLATALTFIVAVMAWGSGEPEKQVLCPGTPWATDLYVIRGQNPGPSVMVIGGIHGTETAGWMVAEQLIQLTVVNGTLVVIPRANKPAIARNARYIKHDLNHSFPGRADGTGEQRLAYEIMQAIGRYDCSLVLGLHQGRGVHGRDAKRSGQTMITGIPRATDDFPWRVVEKTNTYIRNARDQFSVYIYPVAGSSSEESVGKYGNRAYALEASDAYPLRTRARYLRLLVDTCVADAGLRLVGNPAGTAGRRPHPAGPQRRRAP